MTTLLAALLLSAQPGADLETLITQADRLTIEYWEFTDRETIAEWNVDFDRSEIRSVSLMLLQAKPYTPEHGTAFIWCFDGHLTVGDKQYSIRIGEEKMAGRPLMIILQPHKKHARRIYRIPSDETSALGPLLRKSLREKVQDVAPDRTRES